MNQTLPEQLPIFLTGFNQTILPPLLRITTILIIAAATHVLLQKTLLLFFRRIAERSRLSSYRQRLSTFQSLSLSIGSGIVVMLAILVIASDLGFDISPLLTGAGIAGLALSFGAQTLIKDVITGILLFLDNQINVGDTVKLDATKGKVIDMQLRTIVLKDTDDNLVYIPNSEVKKITVLKKNPEILQVK